MDSAHAATEETTRSLSSASILVVDDDPSTLEVMLELLNRAGYRAHGAGSFAAGTRALEESQVSLLITDVRLGAANGLQLVLRAQVSHPATPVIVMTGFADAVLEAEAVRMGAIFLLKPIAADELLAVIRSQLR